MYWHTVAESQYYLKSQYFLAAREAGHGDAVPVAGARSCSTDTLPKKFLRRNSHGVYSIVEVLAPLLCLFTRRTTIVVFIQYVRRNVTAVAHDFLRHVSP